MISMFCTLSDLRNESDVEAKLIMPFLLLGDPNGPAYSPADIHTKRNIVELEIDKGASSKIYRPDFIILLGGLPLIVIEAKNPDEGVEEGFRQARLYASELNSYFPTGLNPCQRIIASNGKRTISGPADSNAIDTDLQLNNFVVSDSKYHIFLRKITRKLWQERANELRREFRPKTYSRATREIGGQAVRNEEIGFNDFGRALSVNYLHIFNPQTREDRARIVHNAYVVSNRREHYVDEIDRVIRATLPVGPSNATVIEDTNSPSALIRAFRRGRDLTHKILLLVGSVGSGKSTFVDYFREVRLPDDIRGSTVWVTMDMNSAPRERTLLEQWVVDRVVSGLRNYTPDIDFDELENIKRIFSVELARLHKGTLRLLKEGSEEYNRALYEELRALTHDSTKVAVALARFHCASHQRLLVVVVDNCDKSDQAVQLQTFEVVRWLQSWLQCLVFLPIRDVTFQTSARVPPLDTVIKDFIFRIEPPPFTEVLSRRIKLALVEMTSSNDSAQKLEYRLSNGMRVVYPATDVGYYLACIFRSIYEHDRLLRRMIIGLAGRNMRTAMEIFLDFCKSGHIGEHEFLKIRVEKGNYALPYHVVTRVLLRLSRRFYDGDESYIKNLFQCDPDDAMPDHFVRLSILAWLHALRKEPGPSGIRGFHRATRLIGELGVLGHDGERIRRELKYLVSSLCVITEHQVSDTVADDDLIALATPGHAHLGLVGNFDYLSSCAEDTWMSDPALVGRIVRRISNIRTHYTRSNVRANAIEFADYLVAQTKANPVNSEAVLSVSPINVHDVITKMAEQVRKSITVDEHGDAWPEVDGQFEVGKCYSGVVEGVREYGVFVNLATKVTGLLHSSKIDYAVLGDLTVGDTLTVRIINIEHARRRISLAYVAH